MATVPGIPMIKVGAALASATAHAKTLPREKGKGASHQKWAIRQFLQIWWLAPFPLGWLLKPSVDYSRSMIRTVEAIVDEKGRVRLSEPLQLSRSQRALVTILDEEPLPQLHEDSLLSEQALAQD